MEQKELIKKLDGLKISNKDKEGNIVRLMASAILVENNQIEIVFYRMENKEPILKFQIEALGCDTKLMHTLIQSYQAYLNQQHEKQQTRDKVLDEVRKEKNKESHVVFTTTKTGNC